MFVKFARLQYKHHIAKKQERNSGFFATFIKKNVSDMFFLIFCAIFKRVAVAKNMKKGAADE